jgi:hypothetical protein
MMMTLPKGSEFQGIYYYQNSDRPSQFYYLPAAPSPQCNAQGIPAISLMVLDQFSMLQLSSQWVVNDRTVDALKVHLSQKFPEIDQAKIDIQLAPVTVNQVQLKLKNQAGNEDILNAGVSSGQSPFSKVFSVDLSAEQQALVIAVFKGRSDLLSICYHGTVQVETSATVTISGDVTSLLKSSSKIATIADCLQAIESAISQKILKLEHSESPTELSDLSYKVEKQCKERAAELLLQMSNSSIKSSKSPFQTTASLKASIPVTFSRSADVSSWFPNGDGSEYMQLIGL